MLKKDLLETLILSREKTLEGLNLLLGSTPGETSIERQAGNMYTMYQAKNPVPLATQIEHTIPRVLRPLSRDIEELKKQKEGQPVLMFLEKFKRFLEDGLVVARKGVDESNRPYFLAYMSSKMKPLSQSSKDPLDRMMLMLDHVLTEYENDTAPALEEEGFARRIEKALDFVAGELN